MVSLASLPPELPLIIFSFPNTGDLWVLAQLYRGFSPLAILPLLATYNLFASQIRYGVVRLPKEATFSRESIASSPSQKLSILRGSLSLRTLTSILAIAPKIPDVTICLSDREMEPRGVEEVASFIAPLSRALHPVMFIATRHGDGHVGLEAPCCGLLNPIHPSFDHCFRGFFSGGGIIMGLIWIVLTVLVLCLNLALLLG
ncbi:hypothetical protein MVEN_01083900 [Mycena venus]|uniref:Uncharacterized protein n=1 Tax=Mycena venus TaxID=2733690 RepID=A0A8H6Y8W2_9AGAR|nr:hypothetical protein MVEN_01083900 [Mycena venus]